MARYRESLARRTASVLSLCYASACAARAHAATKIAHEVTRPTLGVREFSLMRNVTRFDFATVDDTAYTMPQPPHISGHTAYRLPLAYRWLDYCRRASLWHALPPPIT